MTKCYSSIPAVENVSFTIQPGEVLGYLGPNGSGKSTTVKIITGLLEPSAGSVLFEGRNIKDDLAAYKAVIGYVPEEANLYPFLSGLEYLELLSRLRGLPAALAARRLIPFFAFLQCTRTGTPQSEPTRKACVSAYC